MGQYAYLINRDEKIFCESHKITGGGELSLELEKPRKLAEFMEYCRLKNLTIECVSEYWFSDQDEIYISLII